MKFRYETLEIWQLAMKLWEMWQRLEKIFFKAIGFQKWLSKHDSRVSREPRLAG